MYALLGLARDRNELGIEIDYDMPYKEPYIRLARTYIIRGELWFLQYCNFEPDATQFLQSFIPDWSNLIKPRVWRPLGPPWENAAKGTKASARFSIIDQVLY